VRIRIGTLVALSLAVAALAAPRVAADGVGSGILTGQGSFLLNRTGTPGYTLHAYLADMGFPVRPGDTLVYSWSANNGTGPAVYFEIHGHPPGRYDVFYNTTASSVTGSWTARLDEPSMVFWRNDHNGSVNVTFGFSLVPAQSDLWPLFLIPGIVGAVAIVAVTAHLRGRKARPPPWKP